MDEIERQWRVSIENEQHPLPKMKSGIFLQSYLKERRNNRIGVTLVVSGTCVFAVSQQFYQIGWIWWCMWVLLSLVVYLNLDQRRRHFVGASVTEYERESSECRLRHVEKEFEDRMGRMEEDLREIEAVGKELRDRISGLNELVQQEYRARTTRDR